MFGLRRCCCEDFYQCFSIVHPVCKIPKHDLTLHWVNPTLGDGTVTLTYSPPNFWGSVCTNQLLFSVFCSSGEVNFRIVYFISGVCPTGQGLACNTGFSSPFGLTITSLTCGSGFDMVIDPTDCTTIAINDYSSFEITYP